MTLLDNVDDAFEHLKEVVSMTHKHKRGTCEYCEYYDGDDYMGFCHRYPPQAIRQKKFRDYAEAGEETGWAFPSVDANSSCGEWRTSDREE